MTVRVLRPRKSNFTRPAFSTMSLSYWVTMPVSSPAGRKQGTYSHSGRSPMTTPAACLPAWRFSPSSPFATSSSSR